MRLLTFTIVALAVGCGGTDGPDFRTGDDNLDGGAEGGDRLGSGGEGSYGGDGGSMNNVGGSSGGTGGAGPELPSHCSNGALDPLTESDVDCGDECGPCIALQTCNEHEDCADSAPACLNDFCQPLEGCAEAPAEFCNSTLYPNAFACTELRPNDTTVRYSQYLPLPGFTYWRHHWPTVNGESVILGCASTLPDIGGDCKPDSRQRPEACGVDAGTEGNIYFCAIGSPPDATTNCEFMDRSLPGLFERHCCR